MASKRLLEEVEGDGKCLSPEFDNVFDVNYDDRSTRGLMTKGEGDYQRFRNYYLLTQYEN